MDMQLKGISSVNHIISYLRTALDGCDKLNASSAAIDISLAIEKLRAFEVGTNDSSTSWKYIEQTE